MYEFSKGSKTSNKTSLYKESTDMEGLAEISKTKSIKVSSKKYQPSSMATLLQSGAFLRGEKDSINELEDRLKSDFDIYFTENRFSK